jgi:hypothetical protein
LRVSYPNIERSARLYVGETAGDGLYQSRWKPHPDAQLWQHVLYTRFYPEGGTASGVSEPAAPQLPTEVADA